MRVLIPAVVLLAALPAWASEPLTEEEKKAVSSFQDFAKKEWPVILEEIDTGMENAIELMEATKLPMSSKNMYVVFWVENKPDSYTTDVQRTESLQNPLKGIIRFTVDVTKGTILVKGPKKHCKEKPLKECLAAGGEIAKGMFSMGGEFTVTQPHEVVLSYLPEDSGWRREREESVLEIVSTMPSVTSLDK